MKGMRIQDLPMRAQVQIQQQLNNEKNIQSTKTKSLTKVLQDEKEADRSFFFLRACEQEGLFPIKEFKFAKEATKRLWRTDYFFEEGNIKVAVEQEGGTFTNGRHNRGLGYEEDMIKYNFYQSHGIILLRFTTKQMSYFPVQIAKIVKSALLNEDFTSKLLELYK
jgi:uncharacterized protein YegJ (DUF2314 family)